MIVGIISDTHHFFDEKLRHFLQNVDIILHAGDIGSLEVADKIAAFKPLKAVYGNIDDTKIRSVYKDVDRFELQGVKVLMTHIGGYPGHYPAWLRAIIDKERPDLVICGHSHILRVIYDKRYDHLHINPGAAGAYGFHQVRTAIRITIEESIIKDLEIGEWPR